MTRPDPSRDARPDAGAAPRDTGRAADAGPRDRRARPGHAERLPDDRDARIVGDDDDGPLESIGKAIVSPVASADEDAERPADDRGPQGAPLTPVNGRRPPVR